MTSTTTTTTAAATATDKTTNNTKTVLITGATRGIGNRLAETYTKLGWNIIGGARDPTKADLLRALSPYKIVQLDTTDEASILRAAEDLKDEAIDLVINNAGITIGGGLDVTTKEEMLQQFDVNCVGPFLVTRAFIPHDTSSTTGFAWLPPSEPQAEFGGPHFFHAPRRSQASENK